MKRLVNCCLAAAVWIAVSLATGCGFVGCEAQASQQIAQLKKEVLGLLPEVIEATMEEGDDCDSEEGGYLWFTADASMDSEKIIEKFVSSGWRRISQSECPSCLNGVTEDLHGGVINLVVSKSHDGSALEIMASFQ